MGSMSSLGSMSLGSETLGILETNSLFELLM
jgi:hypothetical protein